MIRPLRTLCAALAALAPLPAQASASGPQVDARARAVLQSVERTWRSVQSLTTSASAITRVYSPARNRSLTYRDDAQIRLMRPNLAWNDLFETAPSHATGKPERFHAMTQACDGAAYWRMWDFTNHYYERAAAPRSGAALRLEGPASLLRGMFQSAHPLSKADVDPVLMTQVRSVTYAGTARWNGALYRLIKVSLITPADSGVASHDETMYVGADSLVHRTQHHVVQADGTQIDEDSFLTALNVRPRLTRGDFAYRPPDGAIERLESEADMPSPLAGGSPAPDFAIRGADGSTIRLSDFRGKVVVLDFWATWCASCQAEMAATNELAHAYGENGVVVLGVNILDSEKNFRAWLPLHANLEAIEFAIDPTPDNRDIGSTLYRIVTLPSQYVIGRDGTVVGSVNGYKPDAEALTALVKQALGSQ